MEILGGRGCPVHYNHKYIKYIQMMQPYQNKTVAKYLRGGYTDVSLQLSSNFIFGVICKETEISKN